MQIQNTVPESRYSGIKTVCLPQKSSNANCSWVLSGTASIVHFMATSITILPTFIRITCTNKASDHPQTLYSISKPNQTLIMAQIDLGAAENSHFIQLHTDETTIWRGNEWSKVSICMKVNKAFHKENRSLKVRAFIENGSTGTVYHPATTSKFRMTVKTREKENDLTLANVVRDIRGCSKINLELHKDLFSDGNNFRVIVALFREKDNSDVGIATADPDPDHKTKNSLQIVVFGATRYIT